MVYTTINYKTKKALIEDFKAGKTITVFQPGPFGPQVRDGSCALEGPHYPQAHTWYATAEVKNMVIVKVK